MDIMTAITTVGFPIVCALVMGWFIYKIYTNTTQQNKEAMEQLQARCAEREERLYQQLEKNQEINGQAMATLALYAERLDTIQADVKIIKDKLV
jgi:stress response protein YsnF